MTVQATDAIGSRHHDVTELSARRRAAFARAQRHSKTIALLKRVFPVFAVLVTVAYFVDSKFSFKFGDLTAEIDKVVVTKDQLKMINPRLEGHDEKSGSYLVIADHAVQHAKNPNLINLKIVEGELQHPKNGLVKLTADQGTFDNKSEVMLLDGNIIVKAQNGMVARMHKAHIKFSTQEINSKEPVFIEMKSGTIRSQSMTIDGVNKTMTFVGDVKVKLVKDPDAAKKNEP